MYDLFARCRELVPRGQAEDIARADGRERGDGAEAVGRLPFEGVRRESARQEQGGKGAAGGWLGYQVTTIQRACSY